MPARQNFRFIVSDAMMLVPTTEGKRFATVFQHGTLLVEIYTPRGVDPQQPHTIPAGPWGL